VNIFGVGGAELVLIFVIMLVVAGPQRMIRWAYVIGQYVGKFRIVWEQMVDMMQDEVDAAGLDVKLPKDIPTRQSLAQTANQLIKPYAESMEKSFDEVKQPLQSTFDETTKAVTDAKALGQSAVDDTNKAVQDVKKAPVKASSPSEPSSTETTPAPSTNFGAWTQPKAQGQSVEGEA